MTPPAMNMSALTDIARELDIAFTEAAAPRSGYLSTNGLRMHYLEWGSRDKPPILFLHGAGLSAHTWDLVCLSLAADYRCVALDLRGHGLTDGEHAFSVEVARDDLAGAVEALGFGNFAAVGMSLGGNNLIAYAARYAKKLAAAVFVDAAPAVLPSAAEEAEALRRGLSTARSFDDAVGVAERHNPRGSRAYKRHVLAYSLELANDGRWHQRSERSKRPADPDYMARRRQQLWEAVPLIRCPALVVQGADSRAHNAETLEELVKKLPDGRLVRIEGAGHEVQEDQPRALTAAIREFLAAIKY